jgi:hypothetical protein
VLLPRPLSARNVRILCVTDSRSNVVSGKRIAPSCRLTGDDALVVKTGSDPEVVAVTSDGRWLAIAAKRSVRIGVNALSRQTEDVIGRWPQGSIGVDAPVAVVSNGSARVVYVANMRHRSIASYRPSRSGILRSSRDVATGLGPVDLTLAPRAWALLVADSMAGAVRRFAVRRSGAFRSAGSENYPIIDPSLSRWANRPAA